MADSDDERPHEEAHDEQFEAADAGASDTYPVQCSALRKNGFVMLKDHPCKIVEMSTSKTGKHGHAKVNLVGIDIFTGKKYEDICPSTHNMSVPVVTRKELTLCDISDDKFMSLMDENGNVRDDLKVPEGEIGEGISAKFKDGEQLLVSILKACKMEAAVSFKNEPK